ncbi:MAG: HisA/HisF-related TIM barrel protein [bacterium]|nr:HisA/HisF-related TIM barrel protein [bacterium]
MRIKIETLPAVLPKDFAELAEKIDLVKDMVKTVQIDVCDGQFVPSATWPYNKHDDSFQKILKEEDGLPGWQTLNFEIDLMVNKPETVVDEWVIAGATRIIIHAESRGDVSGAIESLQGRAEVGLALNLDTPIDVIEKYKEKITSVQCMGIFHIGYQGEEFDTRVVEKVREVKNKYPDMVVSVDGGVNMNNAQDLIDAGATRLIVGSAIFNSDNFIEAIQQFKALKKIEE